MTTTIGPDRSYFFFTKTTGADQGQFPSDPDRGSQHGGICYRFRFGGTASNDPTRGGDHAARSHEPVFILKPWDEASAHYVQAFWKNEILSTVEMTFVRRDSAGSEVALETITLKNATIASLKRHVGEIDGLPYAELEEIGFRFEQMEIQAKGAKKSVRFDFKNRK
jgi:type VI secretion system Hcp family effector